MSASHHQDLIIKVLGNGDSLGTPRVYCECAVCEEARGGGLNVRRRSSIWLNTGEEAPLLVDCGPDWRHQMERLGARRVERALLTHAHVDHIGGLAEWADACRWLEMTAELFAPAEVLHDVATRYPWIGGRLLHRPLEQAGDLFYGSWAIRAWKVNHGKNGYSYAYRFDHPDGGSFAYCPDSIDLSDEQKEPLRGLSLLILGTSFYEEPYPMSTRSLYDVKEGLQLTEEVGAPSVVFTHMSHDIDARRDYGLPAWARFAAEGMELRVSAAKRGV
ncbi:MBL fold metallo-hydrolase [Cohnella ginsengisoli]|uniref:MBL fold metallo-hydrolase n=1 Tax=Cohnella ginsengisoli TaxID=425004 RepID=A0A9X4KCN3_9BACL|nr:MBL fold metallo-hydrolase [Cohnella ginsengisoli]MDG0789537.1 MBL fold metallo-hydrolase [Cohnella ginsengisoli]